MWIIRISPLGSLVHVCRECLRHVVDVCDVDDEQADRDRRRPVARIGPVAHDAGGDRAFVGGQPTRRLGLSRSGCDEQREGYTENLSRIELLEEKAEITPDEPAEHTDDDPPPAG